jgi:DNA uptake protein ComE-like DNA-binding protein
LPGIGPVLSVRIIKYRNLLGGFVSVQQLKEVYGLPVETYEMICRRVFADSLSVRKIKVNDAEYKDLIRHPYFKKNEVEAILKYRQLSGSINGLDDMRKNNLISEETCRKIRLYLEF